MTEANNVRYIPLEQITGALGIRKIKPAGVQALREQIEKSGYLVSFPVTVGPGYELIDGQHRLQAARELELASIPAVVVDEALEEKEKKQLARRLNEATANCIPTTFADDAEFIWAEVDAGRTQAEVAEIMGWSREKVRNFISLRGISNEAWAVIGTTLEENEPGAQDGCVPAVGTNVPFSEGLLRSIIQLTPEQQLELVQDLAEGRITKGKFRARAESYRARNEMKEHVKSQLQGLEASYLEDCCQEIDHGGFDKEWTAHREKSVKLDKMIQAARDAWEKKNSIRLIHGDFYEEVGKLPDASVDLIITDPPYNVSSERVFKLAGRKDISQDFGSWDRQEHQAFIELFQIWSSQFKRLLRDGGSGYVFCSDKYISYLRNTLEEAGLTVKATIVWHKTNPGTQVVKTNFRSSVEYILFFVKGENHTFNWQGENEMHNFIEAPICSGHERLKDPKGDTLHPTQKPEAVIRHLMEISSNRGDTVFDGFSGVGTTAKGAKDLGRRAVCIEQDEKYYKAIERRLLE